MGGWGEGGGTKIPKKAKSVVEAQERPPTQPEEHCIPTTQMSQVSTHQVTSNLELAPYKGPEDPQQSVPGEPP